MKQELRVENIKKVYNNRPVVDDICFSVSPGQIVGLLGANGAGKTTAFYITAGFIKPDQGKIFLNDRDITGLAMYKRARMGLGYLPQEACIFRKLTVEDNIKAILETQKISRSERSARLEDLLKKLEITHIRKSYGYALSGGERRRVEIARCLATKPKFLLLDEPFAGVDPLVVLDIQKMIQYLATQDIGILINDHNFRETLGITHRAYIMNRGKILLGGTTSDIVSNPLARKVYFGDNLMVDYNK